jgi:Ribonuclease G/E
LLDGDRLAEYSIWHFTEPGDIGDVYAGRITARVPAMAGSFVELGPATGFLPDSAGASGLTEGCYLAVKITRCAQSGKGPRLAALPQETKHKPGLIRQSLGPLEAVASRYANAPILIDNYELLAKLTTSAAAWIAARLFYNAKTFDAVLEDEIAALAEPAAELGDGARMHITPTPALTAIDVDAGAATADRNTKQRSQLSLNIALMPEIARQILLRNLSGAILIDFAGMKSAARPKLLPALDQALKADPLNPKCVGFSHLGFAEITRPRIRPPLHEFLS